MNFVDKHNVQRVTQRMSERASISMGIAMERCTSLRRAFAAIKDGDYANHTDGGTYMPSLAYADWKNLPY